MDVFVSNLISLLISLIFYVYFAYGLMVIANKTGTENAWLAWIPIANVYLMCKVAGKPGWWLLLFLIPVVNLIVYIMLWMRIAEVRERPGYWGILMLVPLLNVVLFGMMAFAEAHHHPGAITHA